jgi:hypothetical protein
MLERLSLRFVDGHGKGKFQWKLKSGKLQGDISIGGLYLDPGNEGGRTSKVSSDQPDLNDPLAQVSNNTPQAIADTLSWIEISENHDRTSNFDSEMGKWKSRDTNAVEILLRVERASS